MRENVLQQRTVPNPLSAGPFLSYSVICAAGCHLLNISGWQHFGWVTHSFGSNINNNNDGDGGNDDEVWQHCERRR